MMKTTILFYPNERKKSKRSNAIPIYLRLLHNGEKSEKRLNVEIKESDLCLWGKGIGRLNKKNNHVNDYLNNIEAEFNRWNSQNAPNPQKTSIKSLMGILTGDADAETSISLVKYLDNHFDDLVKNGVLRIGTVKNYQKSINHVKNYLNQKGQEKMTLQGFTKKDAHSFKYYLLSEKKDGKVMKELSAATIIKQLKPIFRKAKELDLIQINPFDGVSLSKKYSPKPKLNINEVRRVFVLDLSKNKSLSIYRDLFAFSIMTGLAYKDLMSVKKKEFFADKHGLLLDRTREKTDQGVKQYIPTMANEIFLYFQTLVEVEISTLALPKRSLSNYNDALKVIGALANIDKNLSTHIGRHTCKQLLSEAKINDTATRYSIMGWSHFKGNIELVYSYATDSLLLEAKDLFDKYLST